MAHTSTELLHHRTSQRRSPNSSAMSAGVTHLKIGRASARHVDTPPLSRPLTPPSHPLDTRIHLARVVTLSTGYDRRMTLCGPKHLQCARRSRTWKRRTRRKRLFCAHRSRRFSTDSTLFPHPKVCITIPTSRAIMSRSFHWIPSLVKIRISP